MIRHLFTTFFFTAAVVLLCMRPAYSEVNIYGYLSLYYENVGPDSRAPDNDKGDPPVFDYANLVFMLNAQVTDHIRAFVSLKGAEGIDVSTYWGEYAFKQYLKLRVGKMYRPFDLYNELLDAVPTYLGMEPPELFDGDHLMLPRYGKIMLHGGVSIGMDYLKYAYILDSDETMQASNNDETTLSHGWDINYNIRDMVTIGHSGYIANEQNGSSTEIGNGSPNTGMLPWMVSDKYNVFGGYAKFKKFGITIEGAYYTSHHNAVRDRQSVATLYGNQRSSLNEAQLENFFGEGDYAKTALDPTVSADVITKADYTVWTYYIRLGYTISRGVIKAPVLDKLEFTPYAFLDGYSNPETIASKDWGGDNEAGWADDGFFMKPTLGICIKPSPFLALKLDGSSHIQTVGGEENVHYEEFRIDLSYFFK